MDPATLHVLAALQPHPSRPRYLRGDVIHCPLCGYFMPNEWDSHFTPCLVRHVVAIAWYGHQDACVSRKTASASDAGP